MALKSFVFLIKGLPLPLSLGGAWVEPARLEKGKSEALRIAKQSRRCAQNPDDHPLILAFQDKIQPEITRIEPRPALNKDFGLLERAA